LESLIQSISKISAMTLWHKVKIKLKYVVQFLSLNIPRVRVLELTGSLLHLYLKINIISDLERTGVIPRRFRAKRRDIVPVRPRPAPIIFRLFESSIFGFNVCLMYDLSRVISEN